MDEIRKAVTLAAEPGTKPRTLKFTISTGDLDRMGDTIDPHGWDFSQWLADGAPVLLAHRHDIPQIGRGIDIGTVGDRVKSVVEFPPKGLYPLADSVYDLAKAGFLKSASVGFQATESTYNDETGGRHFLRQILREWSIVPVPALAQAKIEAALGAAAVVEKWLGRSRGRKDRSDCPAGADCPNTTSGDPCPAARLCPMLRPARTSWRSREPAIILLDDDAPDEYLVLAPDETRTVPANVSTRLAPKGTAWTAPALKDFTSKAWSALSDTEKWHIAGYFAWSDEMPPAAYGSLKLPHHRPSDGAVVFRGVVAAAGRLDQTEGIDVAAVKAHLRSHYRAFGEDIPDALKYAGDDVVSVDPGDFAAAWKMATGEIAVEVYNRLKGRVD